MRADRLLELARGELGVTESPAGSNRVRYNTDYYGREVSGTGYSWCCVFVWWLFRQAGAEELFFGGGRTAYCPALLDYHRRAGQAVDGDYRPGDVIFFDFNGNGAPDHVGLCEGWDGDRITTIDGNTGDGDQANGGRVERRTRDKTYICGAYRPAYQTEPAEQADPTEQAWFDRLMEGWLARQAKLPDSDWSRMAQAKALGVTDGARPRCPATREEVATMLLNALKPGP